MYLINCLSFFNSEIALDIDLDAAVMHAIISHSFWIISQDITSDKFINFGDKRFIKLSIKRLVELLGIWKLENIIHVFHDLEDKKYISLIKEKDEILVSILK